MKEKVLIVEDQFVEADYLRVMLVKAGYPVCTIARSVAEAQEIVMKEKPKLVLLDIFLKGKLTGIDLAIKLKEDSIPFIYLSANSNEEVLTAAKATEPYGFLVKPFRENDLLVTLEIAQYRHEQSREARLRTEKLLHNELCNIEKTPGDWTQKLMKTARAVQQYISFDCLAVKFRGLENKHFAGFALLRIGFDEYQTIGVSELSTIAGIDLERIRQMLMNTPFDNIAGWYNGDDFKKLFPVHPMKALFANTFNLSSNMVLPFLSSDNYIFSLSFFRRITDGYNAEKLELLFQMQQPLSAIMNSIAIDEKINALSMNHQSARPESDKYVEPDANFCGIIGNSSALLTVMDLIQQVAPSDTSVLILGESGTGKEKIADCIHNLSQQKGKPFIKVNCAALPPTLIESELFGHEKGAFTGAIDKRIGKFEQADKGSIFLDEIGELPLELQVKLLRVLQEKEIERVGSRSTIKISVRIIAATNRNLEKEVAEGRFRLDLYYRLNVFPILLPALRERREDIPALTSHFINYYNRKTGKKVMGISDKVLKKFAVYNWPGNIRELEHLIERGILLAKGSTIEDVNLPVFNQKENTVSAGEKRIKTMEENERDHILAVLKKCNGRIWGAGAAAEILNLPPSTLKSKMKKLGIKKEYVE
ncbi:MAG: sigma 54-interacting transcriptional regulator [Ferruginibacter sp.]